MLARFIGEGGGGGLPGNMEAPLPTRLSITIILYYCVYYMLMLMHLYKKTIASPYLQCDTPPVE